MSISKTIENTKRFVVTYTVVLTTVRTYLHTMQVSSKNKICT